MFDWITTWIESLGYLGIFGLMVLEHLFPPIPSELVMPLAGFVSSSSTSDMTLAGVILAGSLGSLIGASAWYVVGLLITHEQLMGWVERHGRWLTLKPKDIEKAIAFFQQTGGSWVVGLGRMVPGVRTYVSVPAGLSHMPLLPYLSYSALGTVLWTGALAVAGYVLGDQFDRVQEWLGPVSKIVLISCAIAAVIWIAKRRRHRQS
ncbi:DedA family protein [Leptolyngbya sp. CCNP1308]|uniref:DedA family protein n=1 Tax=Leptolyngbya sp. CCNP1308 TaxID=3110255 RepID=UPI002B207EB3|nr:DedA family protein [Leptolyngbya sp. CCNP1308]MEA5452477.1 DedA family protein [Leptolyngbya sp. CCNP1308]